LPVSDDVRPRVAIVHDYFTQEGGAERVAGDLARLFPGAPVLTSVFDPDRLPERIDPATISATALQPFRRWGVPLAAFAPALPFAFRRLRVDGANVIVSSTSAFAHHARPPRGGVHVAYCHTPPHFLWAPEAYFHGRERLGLALAPALAVLRRLDAAAARRVDIWLANSRFTADRIRATYGREATVVHPPVDTEAFRPAADHSGRFLVVARLRRHKRLELAIEAANRLGAPLDVIGEGPDEPILRRLAGPTVRFHGRLPDAAVREAMARCAALVVPGVEDFGLTTAEVQAAGRPPIAYAAGGAIEIIDDGVTGFLVPDQDPDALADAMRRALRKHLDSAALRASAVRFDRQVFDSRLVAIVDRAHAERGRER
jgi:glycosyltransferase involved in cell wall biosynthesis